MRLLLALRERSLSRCDPRSVPAPSLSILPAVCRFSPAFHVSGLDPLLRVHVSTTLFIPHSIPPGASGSSSCAPLLTFSASCRS